MTDEKPKNGRAIPTRPYKLLLVSTLVLAGVISATIILARSGEDATANAALVFGFVTAMCTMILSFQQQNTHSLVNSTAAELREVKTALAFEKGLRQGEEGDSSTARELRKVSDELQFAKGVTSGIAQEADMPARERP